MDDYRGKWIWITGASAGLGKALALAYDKMNAHLILSSRRKEVLEQVKSECSGLGEKHILPLDLENYSHLDSAMDTILSFTDRVDILINNGGVSQRSEAIETGIDVSKRIMDINFLGTVALTKAVLPLMVNAGSGQIVVISSVVGKFGSPFRSSYSASKHALFGYFDSLRFELEDKGIDITMICPGFIHTDVSRNALSEDGSPTQVMDEKTKNGLEPAEFARRAVKAIRQHKKEVYIGKTEILAIYLRRYFPALFRYVIKRSNVR